MFFYLQVSLQVVLPHSQSDICIGYYWVHDSHVHTAWAVRPLSYAPRNSNGTWHSCTVLWAVLWSLGEGLCRNMCRQNGCQNGGKFKTGAKMLL